MESVAVQTAGLFAILSSLAGMLILCRLTRRRNRRHGSILPARFWTRLSAFTATSATGNGGRCTGERDE